MKGVAARYPAVPPGRDRPVDLEGRINLCRTTHSRPRPCAAESDDLLGAQRLRRPAVARPADRAADDPRLARCGRRARICTSAARASSTCPAPTATTTMPARSWPAPPSRRPSDRLPDLPLEWQALGSLKRRLRNCVVGMRAEPWPYDATEYLALESHLMMRARGMTMDAPGVRP
jgi:sulfur-oxidizing protein SoxA